MGEWLPRKEGMSASGCGVCDRTGIEKSWPYYGPSKCYKNQGSTRLKVDCSNISVDWPDKSKIFLSRSGCEQQQRSILPVEAKPF